MPQVKNYIKNLKERKFIWKSTSDWRPWLERYKTLIKGMRVVCKKFYRIKNDWAGKEHTRYLMCEKLLKQYWGWSSKQL